MKLKKICLLVLTFLFLLNNFALASFDVSRNITASETVHTISPGLKYINSVEVCNDVRQEVYSFEFTPGMETGIVASYGKYIYGFNSVGSMIKSYSGEGRIVGGINTDFFITSTGIPLSCLVANNEIISSCDGRVALGFDKNGFATIGNPDIKAEIKSVDGYRTIPIAHINKTPAIWGAYLVTDKFNSTTKSSVDSIEIVFSIDKVISSGETTYTFDLNGFSAGSDNHTDQSEMFLRLNTEYSIVVEEIRQNVRNGEIPDGCFVVCIPEENFSYLAYGINAGDEFILNISADTAFENCVNIFGAGTQIVKDGRTVAQEDNSVFKYKQPRTAAGIKEDGTVVFVCVDGRNPGVSSGYTITELSEYLISEGCVDAVNFDGGGSTTFYAADIGEISPNLKNTPSDGGERRVADGLLFVNYSQEIGDTAFASVYPSEYLIFNKGVQLELGNNILFADSNYHPNKTDFGNNYTFSSDGRYGVINDGLFIPSGVVGTTFLSLIDNNKSVISDVCKITITDIVDRVDFTSKKSSMDPFDKFSPLNISAYLNTIPVEISKYSVDDIVISKKISGSTSGEDYVEVGLSDAYIDYDSFSFVPLKRGETYRLTVSIGGVSKSVYINVAEHPFADMTEHWASKTSYHMYIEGYLIGELDADGTRLFFPERNMTKAEFCVLLSRALSLDTNDIDDTDMFTDVPEWAVSDVNTLYHYGFLEALVKQTEDGYVELGSSEYITRMDVIRVLGSILSDYDSDENILSEIPVFSDFEALKENDGLYLRTVCEFGILNGYDDGTVKQWNNLTRAEAATVFSRFIDFIE